MHQVLNFKTQGIVFFPGLVSLVKNMARKSGVTIDLSKYLRMSTVTEVYYFIHVYYVTYIVLYFRLPPVQYYILLIPISLVLLHTRRTEFRLILVRKLPLKEK